MPNVRIVKFVINGGMSTIAYIIFSWLLKGLTSSNIRHLKEEITDKHRQEETISISYLQIEKGMR